MEGSESEQVFFLVLSLISSLSILPLFANSGLAWNSPTFFIYFGDSKHYLFFTLEAVLFRTYASNMIGETRKVGGDGHLL